MSRQVGAVHYIYDPVKDLWFQGGNNGLKRWDIKFERAKAYRDAGHAKQAITYHRLPSTSRILTALFELEVPDGRERAEIE